MSCNEFNPFPKDCMLSCPPVPHVFLMITKAVYSTLPTQLSILSFPNYLPFYGSRRSYRCILLTYWEIKLDSSQTNSSYRLVGGILWLRIIIFVFIYLQKGINLDVFMPLYNISINCFNRSTRCRHNMMSNQKKCSSFYSLR